MIRRAIDWVRGNKLSALLVVVVVILVGRQNSPVLYNSMPAGYARGEAMMQKSATFDSVGFAGPQAVQTIENAPVAPATGGGTSKERMVSRTAYISMVVKDVRSTAIQVEKIATTIGEGYVVNSNLSNPEGNGSGYFSVRVLSTKLTDVLNQYRKIGIKVASENIQGSDITNQYQDTQESLRVLTETKTKFEALLRSSTNVEDSLNVLREVQNLQSQIDSLKGQEKYLAESAQYSSIQLNVSQDEYELPYAPEEPWSIGVVFKTAVRDLIRTLRQVAESGIWIAVYAVVWVPILLIVIFIYRRFFKQLV